MEDTADVGGDFTVIIDNRDVDRHRRYPVSADEAIGNGRFEGACDFDEIGSVREIVTLQRGLYLEGMRYIVIAIGQEHEQHTEVVVDITQQIESATSFRIGVGGDTVQASIDQSGIRR